MPEISLAPMLKVTTAPMRLFIRSISENTVLFTEMVVSRAIIHMPQEKLFLLLGPPDDLTIVQLGSSEPDETAAAVGRLISLGWKNFNLNCGCPSERVKAGAFGAILMRFPERICEIVNAVYKKTGAVLSIKMRTGVDELDSYEFFAGLVQKIAGETPCTQFYVHARKCWLKGLSPKENRTIPPLNYQAVYNIKKDYPHLKFYLNGGIGMEEEAKLGNLDGLMIGRKGIENPLLFLYYDSLFKSGQKVSLNGDSEIYRQAVKSYLFKVERVEARRTFIFAPLNNIRKGKANNKEYRRVLTRLMHGTEPIDEAYAILEEYMI